MGVAESLQAIGRIAADSVEFKKGKRGGKRPGAGRKPNLAKALLKGVHRDTIALAIENIDVGNVIQGLLRSKREQMRLETLKFIFDRLQGKPKQDIGISGGVVHAHVRDPHLASLPKEALEALACAYDDVLSRYALPAAEDGPQNQKESVPQTQTVETAIIASENA